jgi:hypothetical protein
MNLPIQSNPVHRTIASRPFAHHGNVAAITVSERGAEAFASGVEASGWLDDVLKVVQTVAPIALPALGV